MKPTLLACAALLASTASLSAELRLPHVFSDHLVLQRDVRAPIWGWAAPGEKVTVEVAGQRHEAAAGEDGRWLVRLEPLQAGGPHELRITAEGRTVTLTDVLVGEVWLASGQSNMEWPVSASKDAQAEAEAADFPRIRLLTVPKSVSQSPKDDIEATSWQVCSPETVGPFSAVAYFFGRELHRELDVPIGLIDATWGGTPAEAWTSREMLGRSDVTRPILEQWDRALAEYPQRRAEWERKLNEWEASPKAKPTHHTDPGPSAGEAAGYARPDFDDSAWQEIAMPAKFPSDMDGAIWYRKVVDVPPAWAGQDLMVTLGAIDDFDTTYFDGTKVGETGKDVPNYWAAPRRYTVPGALVNAGKVTIAVRAFDHFGEGGFGGPAVGMRLTLASEGSESVSLGGAWKQFVELRLNPDDIAGPFGGDGRPQEPAGPNNPNGATGLFNAMIRPVVPYGVAGFIWYQGESNAGRAEQYRTLFPATIRDWREQWGDPKLPFLFVQLANFMAPSDVPTDGGWARLRDAQLHTLRTVPNTGMAVAIDVGEEDDIHPRNKQDVGLRLARWALANTYGKDVVPAGPIAKAGEASFSGRKALIFFDHAHGLKTRDGGELRGFTAAAADGVFVNAAARIVEIDGTPAVEVELPGEGEAIAAVRYAWQDNPIEANLVNGENLPATPFRTDGD